MNRMSNRSLRFRTAACAAALGLTVGSSLAFAADPMTTATGGDLSSVDRKFVTKATTGGMEEVALGELAEKQASSQALKDFGARMVKDHTAANEDLVKVAAAKGVTVPGEMTSSQKSDVEKMSKKSGADFDKAYVKAMVSDHKTDIADFQKEAKSGKDGDLQAFAGKTLPTLREHLQMIESIHDGMK
jgi:putative membrane protein